MSLEIKDIVEGSGGRWEGARYCWKVAEFSIDSRSLSTDAFFIPLKGRHTDGHRAIAHAFERGAIGTMVSATEWHTNAWGTLASRYPFVVVDDPLSALQSLARWHRRKFNIPVIGITGSAGKTTTKEMVAAILSQIGTVVKSRGNFNNHIGLPLSLLDLSHASDFAVMEMGISKTGDMDVLCGIAEPTLALITNIGPAHLEGLGSVEDVAREKGRLFEAVALEGTLVINKDDPHLLVYEDCVPSERRLTYARWQRADMTVYDVDHTPEGTTFRLCGQGLDEVITLAAAGTHHVLNALAASAVTAALRCPPSAIVAGLKSCPIAPRIVRLTRLNVPVLLDMYNANPISMRAAFQLLAQVAPKEARRVALLGDMLELGTFSETAHYEIGQEAAKSGVAALVVVGRWAAAVAAGAMIEGMPREAIATYPDLNAAHDALRVRPGDYWLIKGSRGMEMERAVPLFWEA